MGEERREGLGKENKVAQSMDMENEMRFCWNLTSENSKVDLTFQNGELQS